MKKLAYLIWLIYLLCLPMTAFASAPIAEDKAFAFNAHIIDKNNALVEWRIAPNYFLYAKRMHFTFEPLGATAQIPQGEFKYDRDHGRYEVLAGFLRVPIHVENATDTVRMQVKYQGCASDGFCYPPTEKNVLLNFTAGTAELLATDKVTIRDVTFQNILTDQNKIQGLMQSHHIIIALLIFAGIGFLLALTPCVLPMIPILTSIIVGQKSVSTQKALFLSIIYVLGSAITYAFAGLIAASVGHSLQVWLQQPIIIASISALFALLAFSLFGVFSLHMPNSWHQHVTLLSNQQTGGTYVGVFIMGILSTLIVSPCVTAPLVGVLLYISQTGNMLFGASALFLMGLGMGVPLIAIGFSAGIWLPKSGPWMDGIKKILGFIMLGMAIWLLSRVLPTHITTIMWGVFIIAIALFIAAYMPRLMGKYALNHTIGAFVGVLGALVIVNGFYPLNIVHQQQIISAPSFTIVRNITELDAALSEAKQLKQPVLLDFYADWCESCVAMDKQVFDRDNVKDALKSFRLLRADLSENNAADEALLRQYGVIAPPTVLFFNNEGSEINSKRIVGEVDANEFLNRLHLVTKITCEKNTTC